MDHRLRSEVMGGMSGETASATAPGTLTVCRRLSDKMGTKVAGTIELSPMVTVPIRCQSPGLFPLGSC